MSNEMAERDFNQKSWKLLNLQADTILTMTQNRTEVWKAVMGGMAAGGALAAGTAGLMAAIYHLR